jgi:hypothetical protein
MNTQTELQVACQEKGITCTSVHLGTMKETIACRTYADKSHKETFIRDKWECTLHYNGGTATFDFQTGIGHRVLAPGYKREGSKYVSSSGEVVVSDEEAIARNWLILKRVNKEGKAGNYGKELLGCNVGDVLYSVLSDAEACEMSFEEWCDALGENNDSIKALNTYRLCQENGFKLLRLLGRELVDELRSKEH